MTHGPHDHGASEPPVMDAAFWDERYRSTDKVWSGQPNPQLVAEVTALTPGTALDVGSGEGADAIWLAQRGWRVTAVDISVVALAKAAGHARTAGDDVAGRITWQQADLVDWSPAASSYDLVSAQFMQLPPAERAALQTALAAAVRPGGHLLIVGHHPSDLATGLRRPAIPGLLFTAEDVAATLDGAWEVVVADARPRVARGPDGDDVDIHDSVLLARRRP